MSLSLGVHTCACVLEKACKWLGRLIYMHVCVSTGLSVPWHTYTCTYGLRDRKAGGKELMM